MRPNGWARVVVGIAATSVLVVGCGGEPEDSGNADSRTDEQPERQEATPTPSPEEPAVSGIALLLRDPYSDAGDQISFHDPRSGTPTDILRVGTAEEIDKYVITPDGGLVGMRELSNVLHFFEPDPENGQYVPSGSVEAEGSYSGGAPNFTDIAVGPDGTRIFVEAYVEGVQSAVFSVPFGGDTLRQETTLPQIEDDTANHDDFVWPNEWPTWQPLPDGTVGTISEKNRQIADDDGESWTSQVYTAENDEIFAAAAIEADQRISNRLNGYFSIAPTGENEFLGQYDSELAYPTGDEFLATLRVDPASGEVEVDPLLGLPAGAQIGSTNATLAPDGKQALISTDNGASQIVLLHVADLSDPSSEPRELEIGEAPAVAVLGWLSSDSGIPRRYEDYRDK